MMTIYDEQLDHILNQIVADYPIALDDSAWETGFAHEKIDMLLTNHHLLVVVTNKLSSDLNDAYQVFCKNMTGFYDFLVDRLFASIAGEAPAARLYEAADFLVVVFTAPATNVMEVIGQVAIPFVSEFYGQPLADSQYSHQIATEILQRLFADPDDLKMLKGIIQCLDAMRIQQLQPLSLTRSNPSISLAAGTPDSSSQQAVDEPEPDASSQAPQAPDEILLGHNPRRRTAPLPGYFDSDDCQS